MIFAAAPSQNEVLATLVAHQHATDWSRVVAFHMDDYIGLPRQSDQLFSAYLKRHLFDHLPFKEVHLMNGQLSAIPERYARLIEAEPIDIVCLGIGENGHLAFNDPPVADFNDPVTAKIVSLDETCRNQQVNDGCFPSLADVPLQAITLTIPTLLQADYLFCTVPGPTKREAVRRTLNDPISEDCPSTILRQHRHCILYVDKDAYDPS
jgi:glucosamine-6-phosphate deaminase